MELTHWLQHHWARLILIAVAAYVVWIVMGIVEAVWDVRNRPKESMFWCNKHGYFRSKHVLPLPGVTDVCPICYKGAWDKAGQGLKR